MDTLIHTGTLTRTTLRRDWIRLVLWVVGLGLLTALMAAAVRDLVGTDEGTREFTRLYVVNPVFRMFGLASGATIGAFTLTRGYLFIGVLVALMNIFTVVRNTRANEDLGRTELVGSLAVGRHAGLASALLVALGADLLVAVLVTLGLTANGLDPAGSAAAGASLGALGACMAAVAAVTAQLAGNARKASGLAAALMGLFAAFSSIGNVLGTPDETALRVVPAWPAWLSPFGWGQLMRPFDTDQWILLVPFALFFLALAGLAFLLEAKRDVGQGILPQGRGPPHASRALSSATGLAWRQQRGVFIGWGTALVALSIVYAVVGTEVESLVEELDEMRELFEQMGGTDVILESYFTTVVTMIGLLSVVYVIQALMRARHEEIHGPLESLLSTAVGRSRFLNAHLFTATLGALMILLASGFVMGLTAGWVLHDLAGWTGDLTLSMLAQLPAVLLFAAIAALAYGAAPRRASVIAWGLFVVALVTGPMFGELLDLPQHVMDISPFTHASGPPAESPSRGALAVLLVLAVALWALGIGLLRRRDLDLH